MFRFGDPGGRMYANVGTGNANILAHWTSFINNAGNVVVSAGNGRTGGSSLRFQLASFTSGYLTKTLDSQATWGVASGFRHSLINTAQYAIIQLSDAGTNQIDLRINPDQTLSVTRNGTVLGTSSFSILVNVYYHIELKVLIHPSAGTVELRINGVPRIGPLTGLNTRNTANSSANQILLGTINQASVTTAGTSQVDFDDIVVWDSQATDANGLADIHDFIGDCGLTWLLPTGAGTTTQFTPDSGANYARVNEATPDGDTSYVSDANVGDIDTYAMADLPANIVAVKSVAVCHFARKTDTASRSIVAEIRTNATNYSHITPASLSNGYFYDFSNWGLNPNTGAAWTVADINAIEMGQKIAS